MKASHQDQLLLLELQALDRHISAQEHVRARHPSHALVAELDGRADDLHRAAVSQSAAVSDIRREVLRLEADADKVRARRQLQQGRIDRNEVPLRDISPLQHEIERMDARLSDLDDAQLDAEERLEAAEAAETAMRQEEEALRADSLSAAQTFTTETAEVDEDLVSTRARRDALAERIPADLLAEYDRSRTRNGVLAVVEVRSGFPVGGGADFSPAELSTIAALEADEVYWAEETDQIVVRTTTA